MVYTMIIAYNLDSNTCTPGIWLISNLISRLQNLGQMNCLGFQFPDNHNFLERSNGNYLLRRLGFTSCRKCLQ